VQSLLDKSSTSDSQATSPNSNIRSWKAFADLIAGSWQKQAGAIIETGRHLIEAKQELSRDEFAPLVKLKLPFTSSTARKLMLIAENQIVCAHVHKMPPSWGTLYELTKLSDEVLRAAIKDGRVNPKMQRKDVRALRGQPPDKAPKAKGPVPPLMTSWRSSSDEVKTGLLDTVGINEILRVTSIAFRRDLNARLLKERSDPDNVHDKMTAAFRLAMGHLKIMDDPHTSEPVAQSHVPELLDALRGIARMQPDATDLAITKGKTSNEKRRRAA
jgi:hypothetical protein